MTTQITVSGTLYEIEVSADRQTVTIWANGNFQQYFVSHFGAEPTESEEEIVAQVKGWLVEVWGDR